MDVKILSIYIVFGFFILLGYGRLVYTRHYKSDANKLWSNNGKNQLMKKKWLRHVYNLMIALSFIAGVYLVYYLTTMEGSGNVQYLIYTGSVIFLVYSLAWAYFPFSSYNRLILGLVAIGSVLILSGLSLNAQTNQGSKDIAALVAISVLVIQTGLFDFWIWSGIKPFGNK